MYTESELIGIAKRENNTKRNYLVVNRFQGKHVPVSPGKAFAMFDALAEKLEGVYAEERLLLIGFAETATAIGARLSVRLDSWYMQTTREEIPGVEYLFFTEDHSHAAEQRLVRDDIEALIDSVDRIIFAEDEVTTGNTIFHIIDILEKNYPGRVCFSIASLLNGMDETAMEECADRGIRLHYLLKTNHKDYAKTAEMYEADGSYYEADGSYYEAVNQKERPGQIVRVPFGVNARRRTTGSVYQKACKRLWYSVRELSGIGQEESVLVLGTEEFMYPALFVGESLEKTGCKVRCHATTRSPIAVSRERTYPLHCRYELDSFYQEGRRTFLYDLAAYDRVLILTDAADLNMKGVATLVHALRLCGNEAIELFCWQEGEDEKFL